MLNKELNKEEKSISNQRNETNTQNHYVANNNKDSDNKNSSAAINRRGSGGFYKSNDRRKNFRKNNNNKDSKFIYKNIIYTTKVNKTTKGGRNTSFCVVSVVGDCKSCVGIGFGKSRNISGAIDKSFESARNNIIKPTSITNMRYKFGGSKIIIATNKSNLLRAPAYIASIFEAFGRYGVSCKIIGTKNQMNVIFSVFNALKEMIMINKISKNRSQYINSVLNLNQNK